MHPSTEHLETNLKRGVSVIELSKRLQEVASFVPHGAVVADIGSDHAYLPIALCERGQVTRAVAGEVVKGPYESACRNVKKEGWADHITVRLASGLFAIDENDGVTAVTICGMGGPLIASILEEGNGRLGTVERIIAQPNIHAESVRRWAVANGWTLVDESIVKEDGKIYEVLVLERGEASYDEEDLVFGPFLRVERAPAFVEKWREEHVSLRRVLESLKRAQPSATIEEKRRNVTSQIERIERVVRI